MPFDENKFRVSVETGCIDTVKELGLPSHLNVVGTIAWIDGDDNIPIVMKDHMLKEMFDKQMCIRIDAPSGPKEARVALTNCLLMNDDISYELCCEFINAVPEGQWADIGRSIALYNEVFDSVRKPFNSKWSKDSATWVNHKIGVPAHVYEHSAWVDARLAVGLPVDDDRWKLSSSVMACVENQGSASRFCCSCI